MPSRCSYSVYPGNVVRLLMLLVVRAKLRASAKGFGSANGFEYRELVVDRDCIRGAELERAELGVSRS